MSEGHSRGHAESGSAGSSWGSTWRERRQKRREDQERELVEEQFGLGEGSYQTLRTVSGATGMTNMMKETKKLSGYAGW